MPEWISRQDALAIQRAEHGALAGVRDDGALSSALARPENLYAYGNPDMAALGARNDPFTDGNKRTSFVVCLTFLALKGAALSVDDEANIATWLGLSEGSLDEAVLADWLRARMRQVD